MEERTLPGRATRAQLPWTVASLLLLAVLLGLFVREVVKELETCPQEGDSCIVTGVPDNVVRGRLFTGDGRPLATRFRIVRSIRRARSPLLATDPEGRFCFKLPGGSDEWLQPIPGRSAKPVDPRFRTEAGREALEAARNPNLTLVVVAVPGPPTHWLPVELGGSSGFRPAQTERLASLHDGSDSRTPCRRLGRFGPWWAYNDLGSTWQGRLLRYLPFAGMLAMGLVALIRPPRWAPVAVGLAVVAAHLVLFEILWTR